MFSDKVSPGLPVIECYLWFESCCKPTVFTFIKASLYFRLWQWHMHLLQSTFHISPCQEETFFLPRKGFRVHPTATKISSLLFDLLSLLSSPLHSVFIRMDQIIDLTTPKGFCSLSSRFILYFSLMMAFFTCINTYFISIAPVKYLPNAHSTTEINLRPFIALINLKVTKEQKWRWLK